MMTCEVTKGPALFKLRVSAMIPFAVLLLATGCAFLGVPQQGDTPENQQAIEHLIAKKKYHLALSYLDKMQLDETSVAYTSPHRRITRLIRNLEQETVKKATDMSVQGNYAEAIEIVDHTLEYIPESKKIIDLSSSLKKSRNKRLANASHNLLLSETEYLISQLEWHEEEALLTKQSLLTRWQMGRIKRSLKSLRPDLVDCAEQALASNQEDIAERCLHLASMIEESAEIDKLLNKISVNEKGSPLVPLSDEKKIRPPSATSTTFLEIEERLKKEIDSENLTRAYKTLAELKSFSGKEKQLSIYQQVLDRKKANRIERHLQQGSDLYRNDNISQARDEWLKVLELDPNNHTANEKIDRADKVLRRIEDLQKSQQKEPSRQ